jgi:cellulose synthase/poly-beta-1,6-N-acetylglucosamine synthase-like glycosyltransferase
VPEDPPAVSVVIPAFDEAPALADQLRALAVQDFDGRLEVLVADNGSTDGTPEVARRVGAEVLPGLRVLDASARPGPSAARNAGWRAATGDLVLFCDADDIVAPDWVRGMVAALEKDAVVGGRLEVERLNDPLSRAWRQPPAQTHLPRAEGYLPFAMGSNMGIRAEVLHTLGGFDETLDRSGEEPDLCWRAQLAGSTLGFAPDAVVHYRLRRGLRSLLRQQRRWGLGSVDLYVRFRDRGMPRSSTGAALGHWARLLLATPARLPFRTHRGVWASRLAYRWGRLRGSIEHRTVYL